MLRYFQTSEIRLEKPVAYSLAILAETATRLISARTGVDNYLKPSRTPPYRLRATGAAPDAAALLLASTLPPPARCQKSAAARRREGTERATHSHP